MSNNFSAGPQALGYLYQVRFSLLILLRAPESTELSIESLDDVTLHDDQSNPYELLQLKHSLQKQADLTNRSNDLWKTIRIWSTRIKNGDVLIHRVTLALVTTSTAPENSIASLLRPDQNRNTLLASQKLYEEATSPQNDVLQDKTIKACFRSFANLDDDDRLNLVNAIQVFDRAENVIEIPKVIQGNYFTAVHREHRDDLYRSLEGWWFHKIAQQLSGSARTPVIPRSEVEDVIADLASQYGPDALPTDFFLGEPQIPNDATSRVFVQQLKNIGVSSQRIENAIRDYYRAFAQRSRWIRAELLLDDEIDRYEKRLVDEWKHFSAAYIDAVGSNCSENDLKKCGQAILMHMELKTNLPIRKNVSELYVMRGTYHMLADIINGILPRVWWHPKFLERLQKILNQ